MSKFVLVPDSFKGTMSSREICQIMQNQIIKHFPSSEVISIPVADGGEGSVDAFLEAVGGEKITAMVKNPFMEDMEAFYGIIDGGRTAVIEMAACAGLPLAEGRLDPGRTTTYGVGQLILDAVVRHGCRHLIVGLGGSCTNDAGAGAAAALGVCFYNAQGESFIPTGATLSEVIRIDASSIDDSILQTQVVAMCDIDNPLYGSRGAAHIFAPQKGADIMMVSMLDNELRVFSALVNRDLKTNYSDLPGAGAAGGLGYGLATFLNAKLQSGIETVLDAVGFDQMAKDADLIFTGEGKLDSQSLRGKVVIGVARLAKKMEVPVIAVVGGADDGIDSVYAEGVTAVFPINRLPQDFSISRNHSHENMAFTMDNILRLYKIHK